MRSRAFSLTEIMICVAIIAIVAAITLPVFHRVKLSSKKTASKEALRQNWVALMIYRDDHGGGQDFGTSSAMALPTDDTSDIFRFKPPYVGQRGGLLLYWAPIGEGQDPRIVREWVDYTTKCKSSSILIADKAYDEVALNGSARFEKHRVLGVRLNGKVEERVAPSFNGSPNWFACEPLD